MNATKGILTCVLISSLIATALSIQCYTCFYDAERETVSDKLWNKECISEDFNEDKVDYKDGFKKCYKAVVIEDGNIISAHRGGGPAALSNFVNSVSRNEDDFEVHYCKSALCNGAPSMMTSLGLLLTGFVVLSTVFVSH